MPSLMHIQNHKNAEEPLEGLQVPAAGGGAGAVQPEGQGRKDRAVHKG